MAARRRGRSARVRRHRTCPDNPKAVRSTMSFTCWRTAPRGRRTGRPLTAVLAAMRAGLPRFALTLASGCARGTRRPHPTGSRRGARRRPNSSTQGMSGSLPRRDHGARRRAARLRPRGTRRLRVQGRCWGGGRRRAESRLSAADGPGRDRLFRNDLPPEAERREQRRSPPALHDVTGPRLVRVQGYGMGVATGDIDNDWLGDPLPDAARRRCCGATAHGTSRTSPPAADPARTVESCGVVRRLRPRRVD